MKEEEYIEYRKELLIADFHTDVFQNYLRNQSRQLFSLNHQKPGQKTALSVRTVANYN